MISSRWLRRLAPFCLCLVLLVSACSSAPSKYDQVQQETSGRNAPAAVAKDAEKGGTFNQFFPKASGDYEVVPAQEKQGFAEYKLKQNGDTVAMLTINDTSSLPAAAAKYQDSTEAIAGYPAVDQGTTATGILVNGRYQVKVLSRSPDFTRDNRVEWLQKFDLEGLAQLDPGPTSLKPMPIKPGKQLPTSKTTPKSGQPVLQPAA